MKTTLVANKVKPVDLKTVENQTFELERSLYGVKETLVSSCRFEGKADGESPLKETEDVIVSDCYFDLRYALWHTTYADVLKTTFTKNARAPFWYGKYVKLLESTSEAVKIFRECKDVIVQNSTVNSEEPFWRCNDVTIVDSTISGFYAFIESKKIKLNHIEFSGKYALQYCNKVEILDSNFDTKDAFWHCKNVVVKNSVIKGEYIGWYSENLTFVDCTIESHQPFCYAKNIKLINCKMPNCDLAFENSTAKVSLIGEVDSVKNPKKLIMKSGSIKKIIEDHPLHKIKIKK